ncbi:MAG: hypothetical protein LW884_01195 [Bacteroidetes bacterium]|jgi:hypothetical protein|nr:hypothetical protein [Bacteroidota bacterium]
MHPWRIYTIGLITAGWLYLLPQAVGQTLVFCSSYTEDGSPKGVATQWQIGTEGSSLYILFRGQGKVADGANLRFEIEKKGATFSDKIPLEYPADQGFVVIDYFFGEAGAYEARIVNNGGTVLARQTVQLSLQKTGGTPGAEATPAFAQAQVGFCERVEGDKAIQVAQVFGIGPRGSSVTVFVSNPSPFYTNQLVVDIWKREGKAFTELVETLYLDIDPEDHFVHFPYLFREAGLFRFSFYTKAEKLIQVGYVKTIYD